MPAAAVTAAGAVAVGYMQHRSAGNAAKQQKAATDAALQHETGRESIEDKRYQDRWNDYQQRHAAWEARNFGAKGGGGGEQIQQNYSGAPPAGQSGGGWAPQQAQTLQQLAGSPMGGAAMGAPPDQAGSMADVSSGTPQTLQQLSQWSNWDPYLQAGR